MIKSVFGSNGSVVSTDNRAAKELAVNAPSNASALTLDNGVITFNSASAVYPATDGKVESVTITDGYATVVISHSDVFRTVIENADASYVSVGDDVYAFVPVALAKSGTTVKLFDNNVLVTDYTLANGSIVWQS